MSQIGTQGQQDQRSALRDAWLAAKATEASTLVTYKAAKKAANQAMQDLQNYRNFLFGNADHPGVQDGMANDV